MAIIVAAPSSINWRTFTAESDKIIVWSIRNGIYDNTDITNQCTFIKSGSSASGVVVGEFPGLIYASASSIPIIETALIACYANNLLVDYVYINILNYSLIFNNSVNSVYVPQL
jgi:hypothetical protein